MEDQGSIIKLNRVLSEISNKQRQISLEIIDKEKMLQDKEKTCAFIRDEISNISNEVKALELQCQNKGLEYDISFKQLSALQQQLKALEEYLHYLVKAKLSWRKTIISLNQ